MTSGRGKFLGLYNVSDVVDFYGEPIKTEGSDILFPAGKANGAPWDNRIHFGPGGPPPLPSGGATDNTEKYGRDRLRGSHRQYRSIAVEAVSLRCGPVRQNVFNSLPSAERRRHPK